MVRLARCAMAIAAGVLLVAGAGGCGGSGSGPAASAVPSDKYRPPTDVPAPTTSTVGAGRTYTLPPSLCGASDLSAITELYPTLDGKPLADSSGICTRFLKSATTRVGVTVDSELVKDAKFGQAFLDTGRRLATTQTTDLDGVGTDAYWTVDKYEAKLVTYDGNLILTISITLPGKNSPLPPDTPQRLGRVASGTFAKLAR